MDHIASQKSPIFIVGPPRSGTTLLVSMLGSHSMLSAGPETAFFTHLSEEDLKISSIEKDWPSNALKLLSRLNYTNGQTLAQQYGVSVKEQLNYLSSNPPTAQTLLESIVEVASTKKEKLYWVEKTPLHLLHIPTIIKLYPNAKIIRIVRDPRDAALSMSTKLPYESASFITCCYQWMDYYLKSNLIFENNSSALTIRYEDLIAQPEEKLKLLTQFISLPYEPSMLSFQRTAKEVSTATEHWKRDNHKPLTSENCYNWKRVLSESQINASSQICSEAISHFGYEETESVFNYLEFHSLNRSFVEHNEKAILALINEGYLTKPLPFIANIKMNEAINDKHRLIGPLPTSTRFIEKMIIATRVFLILTNRRLSGSPVLFLSNMEIGSGWLNRCMNFLVRILGKEMALSKNKTNNF